MTDEDKQTERKNDIPKKRSLLRKIAFSITVGAFLIVVFALAVLGYNNVSLSSDEIFARQIDTSIESALFWTKTNRLHILTHKNVALIKMLKEIEPLKTTPVISQIIKGYISSPGWPRCWMKLVDPNWPVNKIELNKVIKKESLDNKWVLYAIAPDKAEITPEQIGLF